MTGEMNTFQKIDILSDALKYLVNNEIDCPISTPRYMDNIKNSKKSPLPINTFEKQVNEAKTGFQIKIIRKDDKNTSKEKKDNGNID